MFGRRPDGRRIKSLDPIFYVGPMIMPKRTDAQVFADMVVDITAVDRYVKANKVEHPGITHMTVIMSAMAKVFSEIPALNRFIMKKRVYARKNLSVCCTVVNEFGPEEPDETVIKIFFENGDNVFSVADKIKKETDIAKTPTEPNAVDKFLKLVFKLPTGFIGGVLSFILWLDRRGMAPKSVVTMSPFHTSMYVTNMASIGMNSVYHHIYDNGNTSMFLAMGKREYAPTFDKNGLKSTARSMHFKFVVDERICSGYVYSKAFKAFEKYIKHPELLENPLEIKQDVK